ncbi:hypothetical protein OF83DRAFT_1170319 [Amylostereum chailletii]|nr:hypothetical protein OF83DRAFT_1170319 [Amylostereum chailletii]
MTRLRVVAGPSTSELTPITVNTGTPHRILSDSFDGHILAYIKDFPGPDGTVAGSDYFNREDRRGITWSIQVQGRVLRPMSADDILFGNTFDRPLNLPWGSSAAFRFMKYIDPTLDHDLASKTKPWALSPLISTMPYFAHTRVDAEAEDVSNAPPDFPSDHSLTDDLSQLRLAVPPYYPTSSSSSSSPSTSASPSPTSSHASSRVSLPSSPDVPPAENPGERKKKHKLSVSSIKAKLPVGSTSEARQARKAKVRMEKEERLQAAREEGVKEADIAAGGGRQAYFADQLNRQRVNFGPEDVITIDFCYGFLTFSPRPSLNLPGGVSFDLMRYWDGQPVRFVCCERKRSAEAGRDGGGGDGGDPWGKILCCVAIEMVEDEDAGGQ